MFRYKYTATIRCCLMLWLMVSSVYAEKNDTLPVDKLGSLAHPIQVGVVTVKPFAIKEGEHYRGVVIELWDAIAAQYGWHYLLHDAGTNYSEAAKKTSQGIYDVTIGNLSTTYDRGVQVDFSRPYLLNYVAILTQSNNKNIFQHIYEIFLASMLPILIVTITIFAFASLVYWLLERRKHPYCVSDSFFSTSIAMLSGDVVDRPSTNMNRLIFICILITGSILQAMLIATITDASIQLKSHHDPFRSKNEIINKKFIVETGSSFAKIVEKLGATAIEVPGGSSAAAQYYMNHSDTIDGFIADHLIVYDIAKKQTHNTYILSQLNLRNDELVFYFKRHFIYEKEVNLALLRLQDSNQAKELCAIYLGVDADLCVL